MVVEQPQIRHSRPSPAAFGNLLQGILVHAQLLKGSAARQTIFSGSQQIVLRIENLKQVQMTE
jgi:hypothetical protein